MQYFQDFQFPQNPKKYSYVPFICNGFFVESVNLEGHQIVDVDKLFDATYTDFRTGKSMAQWNNRVEVWLTAMKATVQNVCQFIH